MTQELHIELELIQTQMAQKPMLRAGSGNARALRIQIMCGKIQEGDGHWPNSSKKLQKARNLANAPLPPDHSALALFAQRTRIPTSARSIGFCAIWVCISSSSSSFGQIGHRKGPVQLALTEISPRCLARRSQTAPVP